jgi:hypothetical protein
MRVDWLSNVRLVAYRDGGPRGDRSDFVDAEQFLIACAKARPGGLVGAVTCANDSPFAADSLGRRERPGTADVTLLLLEIASADAATTAAVDRTLPAVGCR